MQITLRGEGGLYYFTTKLFKDGVDVPVDQTTAQLPLKLTYLVRAHRYNGSEECSGELQLPVYDVS